MDAFSTARARLQRFAQETVDRVTSTSQTTRWRGRRSKNGPAPEPVLGSNTGVDIVTFMQARRAAAELPPIAEIDILMALVTTEAEVLCERAAARERVSGQSKPEEAAA